MPSYDECLVDAELKARAAYAQPDRCYHDQRHLEECLDQLDKVRDLDERERRILRWAILWHDAVYEPGRRDNEERSADLASSELRGCGVPEEEAAEVARLIRVTEHHRPDPGDRLGGIIVSIDLAVLGSEPDSYREYSSEVRHEYAYVPDQLWRTGRAAVLKRLLAKEPLYPDPDFRARLEEQARRNMQEELKSLGEG